MNKHGFAVAKNDQGPPGRETSFFGAATAKAVKKFQEAYKGLILKPFNLEKGTGLFGLRTMLIINAVR